MKKNILDEISLEDFLKTNKIDKFRKNQIYHEIFKNSVLEFDNMTTIWLDLRSLLNQNFEIVWFNSTKILESENTTKFLFETTDWQIFESVLMIHFSKYVENKINRLTICVSTQIWCTVWCSFCVTWKLWFKKNLTDYEIIWQILFVNEYIKNRFWKKEDSSLFKIRNVVFMWMWEPLLNYENLKKSINIMLDQKKLSLSKRHITISTSWIIPWINKLVNDNIDVWLAISLHSPFQEIREKIIPIWKVYKLDALLESIKNYYINTKNRIFYEYIMIDWITDRDEDSKQLVKILKWTDCHLNLIPYNENAFIDHWYKESTEQNIFKFKTFLERNNITCTIRDNYWRQLKSACWQLWYETLENKQ